MIDGKKEPKSKTANINVKILRNDPSGDKTPFWQVYKVPIDKNQLFSVLAILNYIYEYLDASIAFIGPCERGLCGACSIMINGKTKLACKTFVNSDIELKPLKKYKIIRDLVVNRI